MVLLVCPLRSSSGGAFGGTSEGCTVAKFSEARCTYNINVRARDMLISSEVRLIEVPAFDGAVACRLDGAKRLGMGRAYTFIWV
jgi:hypothetical protein